MGRRKHITRNDRLERAFIKVYREDSLREHHGKCAFCHEPLTYRSVTADHKDPKSKGGLNRKENIISACFPCNQAKGSMSNAEFRKLIKSFPSGRHIKVILTWSRRRINLQVDRSIKNISTLFGLRIL